MQPKTPLFTSGSQHTPRFGHAVYLGEYIELVHMLQLLFLMKLHNLEDHGTVCSRVQEQ